VASPVRLTTVLAAAAGVVATLVVTTSVGGSGVLPGRAADPTDQPSAVVTETYVPDDPEEIVAAPSASNSRHTTLVIPRLGLRVPVVKGTDEAALARGVGQWENDTEPGGRGNYVLAGHRVTHGEPFADMPELRKGDKVVIETAQYRFVYTMVTRGDAYRVDDADMWPVEAMPKPMQGGSNRILTLITCAETFHTADRFIAFGHLQSVQLVDGAGGPRQGS
jgi:sortase A